MDHLQLCLAMDHVQLCLAMDHGATKPRGEMYLPFTFLSREDVPTV
jgi:hypothetical protein